MQLRDPIYLIGPSGVGKTTCATAAAKSLGANICKLDELCRGRTNDWLFCREVMLRAVANCQQQNDLTIIDIGAGTQHDCRGALLEFLLDRRHRALLIWAQPSEVIMRNPLGPNRSTDEYLRTEYTSREQLYAGPVHKLDVSGLSESQMREAFVNYLSNNFI